MTPFEAATQLYQNTAEHNALNDLGDEGRLNADRMFKLKLQQNESNLIIGRNSSELAERQRINQLDRLQQKNEAANALYSRAKQYGFTPDPKKSLDDNVAGAQSAINKQVLNGYKGVIAMRDKAQADASALLDKLGANKPIDQTRLNQIILQDPSLANTLNAADKQKLASGTSPEDLVKHWTFYPGAGKDRAALLSAAATARAALQQEQQQIAQAKAGQAFKLLESKYAEHNELASTMLKSLPPELVGEALSSGAPSTSGMSSPPVGSGGLLTSLTDGKDAAPVTPPAKTPPKAADPVLQHVDFKAAQNSFEGANARVKAAKAQVDDLSAKIMNSDDLPADQREALSEEYQKAKKELESATADSNDALKQGLSVYHSLTGTNDFIKAIGYYPGGPGGASLPKITPQTPPAWNGPGQPAAPPPTMDPGQPAYHFSQPAPAPVAPTATAPATNAPSAMNNPMQLRAAQNQVAQLLGTNDPNVLYAARQYAKTNLGMDDNTINGMVQAAVNGDQNALQTARQIVARVSQPGNQQPQPVMAQPNVQASLPPEPAFA